MLRNVRSICHNEHLIFTIPGEQPTILWHAGCADGPFLLAGVCGCPGGATAAHGLSKTRPAGSAARRGVRCGCGHGRFLVNTAAPDGRGLDGVEGRWIGRNVRAGADWWAVRFAGPWVRQHRPGLLTALLGGPRTDGECRDDFRIRLFDNCAFSRRAGFRRRWVCSFGRSSGCESAHLFPDFGSKPAGCRRWSLFAGALTNNGRRHWRIERIRK